MSFYWRWVVVRTAMAAIAGIIESAAYYYSALTWKTEFTLLSIASWIVALALLSFSEAHVLRSRFSGLGIWAYVALATLPFAILAGAPFLYVWSDSSLLEFANEARTAEVSYTPSWFDFLVGFGIALALLPFALLPWLAVRRVARGVVAWAISLFLAFLFGSVVVVGLPTLLGQTAAYPDYTTMRGFSVDYAASLASQFLYALLSGIGVARLRPKPEASP